MIRRRFNSSYLVVKLGIVWTQRNCYILSKIILHMLKGITLKKRIHVHRRPTLCWKIKVTRKNWHVTHKGRQLRFITYIFKYWRTVQIHKFMSQYQIHSINITRMCPEWIVHTCNKEFINIITRFCPLMKIQKTTNRLNNKQLGNWK